MAEPKVIAVVGATGAQGGGLARAIGSSPDSGFAVRALTRTPAGEKARSLADAGVEVVQADIDDQASLERAFAGAHGAFCVTNFWEHFSAEREVTQARAMARAAKAAGLRHVVWSTLEDTRRWVPLESEQMPTLQGKYKVPHFDGKGEGDAEFREAGVPTTYLMASFYWENLIYFGAGPQRQADGTFAITYPMGDRKLPGIAAEDIGKCALGIFRHGDEFVGRTVGLAGEHLTCAEMAEALTKALGQPIRYNDVPPEVFRSFGFPAADDLGNMFQFYRDFNEYLTGARPVDLSRSLNPELLTFRRWLARYGSLIPLQ